MAIKFVVVGPTKERFFQQSEQEYLKRLGKYCKLHYVQLPASKKTENRELCLKMEEEGFLKQIAETDYLVILDEAGKEFSSRKFSKNVNDLLVNQPNVVFAIGGAFGFSDSVYQRANDKWSLSLLTFPHHLVRTIFLEQLYRSFTILNGENYHND
ncbi:MAG: rRNA ((1915)-N(3))-methyltransferase RlmH [Bacteroidota bacterium]|jgi:23S rRNA (pseudouridine1915-N3)-methyltransferase